MISIFSIIKNMFGFKPKEKLGQFELSQDLSEFEGLTKMLISLGARPLSRIIIDGNNRYFEFVYGDNKLNLRGDSNGISIEYYDTNSVQIIEELLDKMDKF